ncbi:MAG: anthranilate synthase component I family protein [Myxococcales bacterium]|nr:anthranilate synthase component I family protein [Myxococcales bacterium]
MPNSPTLLPCPPTDAVFVLGGHGARRWRVLGAAQPDACVWLAPRDVATQAKLHLDRADRDRARNQADALLRQIDDWHGAGLAVAGWLGFEVGVAREDLPVRPARGGWPDADLVAFQPTSLRAGALPAPAPGRPRAALPRTLTRQRAAYLTAVEAALAAIGSGEVYQVNVTVAARAAWAGRTAPDPAACVAAALAVQPVPFAAAFAGQGGVLACGSMEEFLAVQHGTVRSRPIKGTCRRGASPGRDAALRRRLLASEKELAENTMIVDMVRNDLQQACQWGSVDVAALCRAEAFASLWHLESDVRGVLRPGFGLGQLLGATLPPASVTGCPKVQACQVIGRLEKRWRGPYCGTYGIALPDGTAQWAVGIRQVVVGAGWAEVAAGAGIVADSVPAAEWAETCLKARSGLALLDRLRAFARLAEEPVP